MTNNMTVTTVVVFGAGMTLIGFATAGFQNGIHLQDGVEFVTGLILIATYHFWFEKDINRKIKVLKDKNEVLHDEITLLRIAMLKKQ